MSLGVTFVVTLGILIGLLYISACIPKEAFRNHLLESAQWLEENEDEFYFLKENNERTIIDNYADTIVYNILYSVDSGQRLESLMISPFYSDKANPEYQMITLLRERIEAEKEVDTVYDRYWHGMQMILRPLFVFFDILQIRYIMIGILSIGLFLVQWKLWKRGQKALAMGMFIGAVLVAYPMIGMCMEYVSTFLIMLFVSCISMKYYDDKKLVINILLISGMCCGFFDFLTTETVTFVVPLAIVLCLRDKEKLLEVFWKECIFIISSGFVWAIGYLGVFISKWIFSGLFLKSNRFLPALSMMLYRQGAQVTSEIDNGISQPLEALARNLRLLLGFSPGLEDGMVLVITVSVLSVMACFVYLYRKNGKECVLPALLALLALVPVIRILILNSHSYQHNFFTYRALFASVCCIITAVSKVIDLDLVKMKK